MEKLHITKHPVIDMLSRILQENLVEASNYEIVWIDEPYYQVDFDIACDSEGDADRQIVGLYNEGHIDIASNCVADDSFDGTKCRYLLEIQVAD